MIDKKKQKMQDKMRLDKEKKAKASPGGRSFSDKAMSKIQQRSRPTKSKMIVKSPGGGKRRGSKRGF